MSDPATFEKITALEGRLAVALERISQAVTEGSAQASDQAELAQIKAELGAETKTRKEIAEQLKAIEAARQADREEAARQSKAADDKAETLAAELEALKSAKAAAPSQADTAESATSDDVSSEGELLILRRRAARLREERNEARRERDEARDELDEIATRATGDAIEETARVAGLLEQMQALKAANASLTDVLEEMRSAAGAPDEELATAGLEAELAALKAERAAEVEELNEILVELRPIPRGGAA